MRPLKHPYPRVKCPVCGKTVAGRPCQWARGTTRLDITTGAPTHVHPVWHCHAGMEQPRHMGSRGCEGQWLKVPIETEAA